MSLYCVVDAMYRGYRAQRQGQSCDQAPGERCPEIPAYEGQSQGNWCRDMGSTAANGQPWEGKDWLLAANRAPADNHIPRSSQFPNGGRVTQFCRAPTWDSLRSHAARPASRSHPWPQGTVPKGRRGAPRLRRRCRRFSAGRSWKAAVRGKVTCDVAGIGFNLAWAKQRGRPEWRQSTWRSHTRQPETRRPVGVVAGRRAVWMNTSGTTRPFQVSPAT